MKKDMSFLLKKYGAKVGATDDFVQDVLAVHRHLNSDQNEFDHLVEMLDNNTLNLRHLEMAYRHHIKRRKDIPEGVRNLLVQPNGAGIIQFANHFMQIIGKMELAYRRGIQHGEENNIKKQ